MGVASAAMDDRGDGVMGRDVLASLDVFGPPGPGVTGMAARVHPDARFASLDDLARACPPAAAGLRPGVFIALFAPLFGEFE